MVKANGEWTDSVCVRCIRSHLISSVFSCRKQKNIVVGGVGGDVDETLVHMCFIFIFRIGVNEASDCQRMEGCECHEPCFFFSVVVFNSTPHATMLLTNLPTNWSIIYHYYVVHTRAKEQSTLTSERCECDGREQMLNWPECKRLINLIRIT